MCRASLIRRSDTATTRLYSVKGSISDRSLRAHCYELLGMTLLKSNHPNVDLFCYSVRLLQQQGNLPRLYSPIGATRLTARYPQHAKLVCTPCVLENHFLFHRYLSGYSERMKEAHMLPREETHLQLHRPSTNKYFTFSCSAQTCHK